MGFYFFLNFFKNFFSQSSILHMVVYAVFPNKKRLPLGWVNFPLFDFNGRLRQGYHSLRLWQSIPNPTGTIRENSKDFLLSRLTFEIVYDNINHDIFFQFNLPSLLFTNCKIDYV
jgi:hypothetical protein